MMNTQFLNEKLEECKHFDKDNRYLPTNTLKHLLIDLWLQPTFAQKS